jgi:hypothetical protein
MNTGAAFTATALAFVSGILANVKSTGPLPDLVTMLPKSLSPSNVHFSHAFEDFSAAYYISTENLLELDEKQDAVVLVPKTDAVVADCKLNGNPLKAVLIRYNSPDARNKAYSAFVSGFLRVKSKPGSKQQIADLGRTGFCGVQQLERGGKPMIALVFEAKSPAACKSALLALVKGATVGK